MKFLDTSWLVVLTAIIVKAFLCWDSLMAQPMQKNSSPYMTELPAPIAPDTITVQQRDVLLDLLNTSLQSLAEQDRRGRMIGGYVLLGLGAGSAVGGAVTLAVGEGEDADIVGYSLLGGGFLLSGLSLVPFKIKSEAEHLYADFNIDLETNPGQREQRYYYWDRRFQELAEKSRQGRIIGGITSIVAGGVSSLLLVDDATGRINTFLWPAIGGVTSLLVKSEVERRYKSYWQAREDILGQTTQREISVGLQPLATRGIAVTVQLQF